MKVPAPHILSRARHEAAKPRSREAAKPRSREADYTACQASRTTTGICVPWLALYDRLRPVCKAFFRGGSLALLLTFPSWAANDGSGTAAQGELIRCPDWERLAPPVILASGREGQTGKAFEARAGGAATANPGQAPARSCSHVVVAGDTLGGIAAARLGKSSRWREIAAANPGVTPNRLRIGSVLKLPCSDGGAGEAGAGDPPARAGLIDRLRESLAKPTPAAAEPARSARTTSEGTAAARSDAPEEKPPLPPPPVWTAAQGEFLADVLTRWGTKAGWTVIVDTTDAWRLQVAFRAEAAFDAAVAELIRGLGHDGVPPRVRLYPNQVLRLGGPL